MNRKLFAGVDYQFFAVGSDCRPKVTTKNRKSQNDMTVTGLIYERGNKKPCGLSRLQKFYAGILTEQYLKSSVCNLNIVNYIVLLSSQSHRGMKLIKSKHFYFTNDPKKLHKNLWKICFRNSGTFKIGLSGQI